MSASFLPQRSLVAVSLLCATIIALVPSPARAWGNEGHRVTGLVADELLTARARIRLNQLVPGIQIGEFASQMDVFRAALSIELPNSEKWHYDNQPVCGSRAYADYCPNDHCASAKIPVYFKVLADENATTEARAQAAMFLIHMVGDIHQPLHAADDSDLGGNQKNVRIPGQDPMQFRNLHRIWDSDLVKQALRGVSEADFARQLVARYRQNEIPAWQRGDVRDWMNESLVLSQKVVYGPLPQYTCGVPWPKEKEVALSADYTGQASATVPVQLAKAGARIAWLLNRALDPKAAPEAATAPKPLSLSRVSPIPPVSALPPVPSVPAAFDKVNKSTLATYVMLIRLRYDLYAKWKSTGKWPDDADANKALAGHAAYWQEQLKAGRALVAGGMTGDYWDNMALIIFEAGSQPEADALIAADPAIKAFVFQAQARPFDLHFISNKYSAGALEGK